jgi:hypothetical protein
VFLDCWRLWIGDKLVKTPTASGVFRCSFRKNPQLRPISYSYRQGISAGTEKRENEKERYSP